MYRLAPSTLRPWVSTVRLSHPIRPTTQIRHYAQKVAAAAAASKTKARTTNINTPGVLDWPWAKTWKDEKTGEQVKERVMYSRPNGFNPALLWVAILSIAPACFLTADTLTLQSAREAEEATKENAQAETLATGQTPDEEETYVSYVLNALNRRSILAMLLMASGGIITLGLLYFPTRQVRRLSQVQRMKPDGVMREMIRMETLAHEQWMGLLGRSREVPKDKVSWGLIRGGTTSSPYLKLNITPPAGKRFSLDKHSYRLNFSKIGPDDYEYDPKKTDEQNEVVVSWRRLETVLGKVGGH